MPYSIYKNTVLDKIRHLALIDIVRIIQIKIKVFITEKPLLH